MKETGGTDEELLVLDAGAYWDGLAVESGPFDVPFGCSWEPESVVGAALIEPALLLPVFEAAVAAPVTLEYPGSGVAPGVDDVAALAVPGTISSEDVAAVFEGDAVAAG